LSGYLMALLGTDPLCGNVRRATARVHGGRSIRRAHDVGNDLAHQDELLERFRGRGPLRRHVVDGRLARPRPVACHGFPSLVPATHPTITECPGHR
jgi:hypothetical protein